MPRVNPQGENPVKSAYVIPFSWRNLVTTVLLAGVLWLTPFIVWPSGSVPRKPGERRTPPVIRFMGAFQGVDTAWSPVVFPLPTRYGFSESGDAEDRGRDMGVILKPSQSKGLFLDVEAPLAPEKPLGMVDSAEYVAGFRPGVASGLRFEEDGGKAWAAWSIEMDAPLKARGYHVDWAAVTMAGSAARGYVDAYVDLDPRGLPSHVLMETGSGNAGLDKEMMRVLRAGRGDPGAEAVGGRVRLMFRGAEAGKSGASSEGRAGTP